MAHYPIVARVDPAKILQAEVVFGIGREEFVATDVKWRIFKELNGEGNARLPPNHDWKWTRKLEEPETPSHFMALIYAGDIQGLAMLSSIPVSSRRPGTTHKPVLYVEYLETAPWNQKAYAGENTRFWGVGTCLIAAAIAVSDQLGCEGRLGLHSLEDARKFYLDQGFDNLGFDSAEGYDYFELSVSEQEDWELK